MKFYAAEVKFHAAEAGYPGDWEVLRTHGGDESVFVVLREGKGPWRAYWLGSQLYPDEIIGEFPKVTLAMKACEALAERRRLEQIAAGPCP